MAMEGDDDFQLLIKRLQHPPITTSLTVKKDISKLERTEIDCLWHGFLENFPVVLSPIIEKGGKDISEDTQNGARKEKCGVGPSRARGSKKTPRRELQTKSIENILTHWKSHDAMKAVLAERGEERSWDPFAVYDMLRLALAKKGSLHSDSYMCNKVKAAVTNVWAKEIEQFLLLLLELAHYVVGGENPYIPIHMVCVISLIQRLLPDTRISQEVKNQVLSLCKLWLKRNIYIEENILTITFRYVLKKSLQVNALKADVHHVWTFREVLRRVAENKDTLKSLKSDLLETVTSKRYLKNKEGTNFIGYMMAVDPNLTLSAHEVIKDRLMRNKEGDEYGKIYFYAWHTASTQMKKTIEEECIQFYMLKAIMLPRANLKMSLPGHNSLRILSHFHRQGLGHVKKMLSTLYGPILWRNLSSHSNLIRCNAAEVFFDAYPLEKPGQGRQANEVYRNQQHDIISNLLTDKCHIVRIIAIRQVCNVLALYWEAIPGATIQKWMKTISSLANDFSSLYVRRSVFKGLPKLLHNAHALVYLEQALPFFSKNFHDPNEQVRSAFVDMLLAIKKAKQTLKFWRVVPLPEIVCRLELESEVVGVKIVDLLFDSFFAPHFDAATTIMRLLYLIDLSPPASLKFFCFSKRRLPLERAVEMMLHILTYVRGYVKEKLDKQKTEPSRKKKKLFSGKENDDSDVGSLVEEASLDVSCTMSTTTEVTENSESRSESFSLENLQKCKTVLEIAGIIWCVHAADLEKPENSELKKKVYAVCESSLNILLRFYRNNIGVYSAVLGICSFMPLSRLKFVSTVESSCMSQLKQMHLDSPPDHVRMFLVPLCMWGRGADIIELAKEWFKETFKNANISTVRRSSTSRRRLVNFKQVMRPKPRLGVVFIDTIISIPRCRNRVLAKHSGEMVQLWLFMGNVKELLDKRLQRGEAFEDENVSDVFLLEYFDLYLTLIIALDQVTYEEQPLNAVQEMKLIMTWATETLLPHVPSELPEESDAIEIPFVVSTFHLIFKYTSLLMPMGKVDLDLIRSEAVLMKEVLSKGSKLMFVNPASVYIGYLMDYVKATDSKDQLHLFRRVILNLVSMILVALSEKYIDQQYLKQFVEDLGKTKHVITEVLSMCQKLSVKLHEVVIVVIVKTVVNILREAARAEELIEPVDKIHNLPFMANVLVSMFMANVSRGSNFFTGFKKYFRDYSKEDPEYLIAALNLFYTIVHSKTKAQPEVLLSIFDTAKDAFKSETIKQRSAKQKRSGDGGNDDDDGDELLFISKGKKVISSIEEKLLGRPACDAVQLVQNLLQDLQNVEENGEQNGEESGEQNGKQNGKQNEKQKGK